MKCEEPLSESGMTFGPFPEGYCFPIEKSAAYRKIKAHTKIAEFLLLRTTGGKPPVIWVMEAKSSASRPETRPNFGNFIDEIRMKLDNAMSLWLAIRLGRHREAEPELSEPFRQVKLEAVDFRLVLVVNGHPEQGLPPLLDALSQALRPVAKTWTLSPNAVAVINDKGARKHGLIRQS